MGPLPRFVADARVATLCRIAIGALFIYAASSKFDAIKFAQEVNNYRLLPAVFVNLVAVALPFVELFAGIMLIAGFRIRASSLTIVGLLCGFIFAMSFVWAKGIDIECGCFGKGTKVGVRAISEDVGMMLLALEAYAYDVGSFGVDGLIARLRRRPAA
jgi:putative oxidoreductase